jgi:hypothetical protein
MTNWRRLLYGVTILLGNIAIAVVAALSTIIFIAWLFQRDSLGQRRGDRILAVRRKGYVGKVASEKVDHGLTKAGEFCETAPLKSVKL